MPAKKRILRKIIIRFFLALALLIAVFIAYLAFVAIDRPPKVADLSSLKITRTDLGNNRYTYGPNWMRKSESGLWEVYLEGKPFNRGVAFGQLTKELLYYQESSFFEQIRVLVPSDNYLKVLKYFIAFFNRNLDKSITDEYKKEIYGTSFACDPSFDFIGSGYQRQLNYHAAHDIGHALQGLNLVACTSFSAWDGNSEDSSLIVGRNFDFYMGEKFAENKIVCFVRPDSGFKFMMVTWADLIGVVSGMNDQGLTVTLNAAKSHIPMQASTPVTLLAREILQYASNIEEAYQIALKRDLFVSESVMIGSSYDHMTAIIEKTPGATALFYPGKDHIICSNHFQSDELANEEINQANIRGSDSYNRYKRVEELLSQYGRINEYSAAALLRNQKVLGNRDAGMGNQLAINQLIAHHSVIFKPDSLIAWVSTSPWQLGKYVAYDLNKIFNRNAGIPEHEIIDVNKSIPADPFLQSADYKNFIRFQEMNRQLLMLRNLKQKLPDNFEQEFIHTNPAFYLTYVHLAGYFEAVKKYNNARDYYEIALKCILPGADERSVIKEKIRKINNKISHGHS